MTFRSLDFIYMPSANVEKDLKYYVRAIGAEPVFSIKAFGTRVAALRVGDGPMLLLAGHLEGRVPILIYRVDDFKETVKSLTEHGVKGQHVEIPHGPCFSFELEGGQRMAVYELARPGVDAHFAGRFDPET